jgi:hypothetical protein
MKEATEQLKSQLEGEKQERAAAEDNILKVLEDISSKIC